MKALILYGCNAGHLDHSDGNVASQFAQLVNGAPVLENDETTYGRTSFGNYKSKNDKYFKDWINSERENRGWIKYQQSDDGNLNIWTLDDTKMKLKDMLKKVNKSK